MTIDSRPQPYVLDTEQGRAIWHRGTLMHFKAVGADNGGRFWLAEQTAAAGTGVPPHVHAREDELWYVLDGEISFHVGEEEVRTTAGSVVYGPRGVAHAYRVESPTARLLCLGTPAGFEDFFFQTGEPARALAVPPSPGPADLERFAAALARFGVRLV